jgi:hypothetical protein
LAVLEQLIKKELEQKVVKEVREEEVKWFNPILAVPKGKSGKWRKVVDCHLLNEHLLTEHFKMEDV